MVARAVADDVDAADPGRAPGRGDRPGGTAGGLDGRADRRRTLPDLPRDDALDHRGTAVSAARPVAATITWATRSRTTASVSGVHRIIGHQHVHLLEREHEPRGDLLELGGVGQHHHRARHPLERAVDEDLGDGVVHESLLHADRTDPHEQQVGAQLVRRELGEVAEHRVHPRPHHTAEDDQLDPLAVQERVRHVQRIRDDGEAAVRDLAREQQGRAPAADGDRRLVGDEGGCRPGDRPLRLEARIDPGRRREPVREGGAPVGADEAALASEPLEVPPDRGRCHAEVGRKLGHACPPVGAEMLHQARTALRLPHACMVRALLLTLSSRGAWFCAPCETISAHNLQRCRPTPYDASRWPTCSAPFAASTPAARRPGRSPCSRSTTGRTCARSCDPRILRPSASRRWWTSSARWCVRSGRRGPASSSTRRSVSRRRSRTGPCPDARASSWPSRPPATRVRRPPVSAASCPAGASTGSSGWAPPRRSSSSTTTRTR